MNITIIGTGNLSWHLARALSPCCNSLCVVSRKSIKSIQDYPNSVIYVPYSSTWPLADIYIFAVPDYLIQHQANRNKWHQDSVLIHCSGAMSLDTLNNPYSDHYGVLYFLQTFTHGVNLQMNKIPLFIESSTEKSNEAIEFISKNLHISPIRLNTSDRLKLHLAAVFINNFATELHHIASNLVRQIPNGNTEWLSPLLAETVRKSLQIGPEKALTGPAKRGDILTIQKHLSQIENPDLATLYTTFTNIIQQHNPVDNGGTE